MLFKVYSTPLKLYGMHHRVIKIEGEVGDGTAPQGSGHATKSVRVQGVSGQCC